jgi:signal transduction histidine kinase/CHASE3 domain sensor protein
MTAADPHGRALWARRSLRAKLLTTVAVPIVALLIAIAAIFTTRLIGTRAADDAVRAMETQLALDQVLLLTVEAETSTRGYLATGRSEFLEPRDHAIRRLPAARAQLDQLIADQGGQRDRLSRVDSALATEIATLRTLDDVPNRSPQRTEALLASKNRMDDLRAVLTEIAQYEQAEERKKAAAAAQLRSTVTTITLAAGGLGLIGGLVAMSALSTGLARRVRLVHENARRLAESQPLLPMPTGEDELSELGTTMARTAELIADKQAMLELTLRTGGLILFELHADGYVRTRGDPDLIVDLGLSTDRPMELGWLRTKLHLGDPLATSDGHPDDTGASRADLSVPTVDGQERRLEVRWREVIGEDGQPTGLVVGVASDVTDRLRAQRAFELARDAAERANLAKDEFLSRMSHELRTPLNAVLGFAQLLAMDGLDEEQRDSVEHILRGGRHLLALVNEVLDLARVESGSFALSIEAIQVSEVVEDAVRLMRPIAVEGGIDVRIDADSTAEAYVSADHQRLKQVLINLVSNGIKYNRAGGSVTIGWALEQSERVTVRVRDTGPGIPARKLHHLFTPFERLGAEQTVVEGTGLGLALSHRLVQAMDGTLMLESTGPEGSTFVAQLPAAERPSRQAEAPTDQPAVAEEPLPDLRDVTVLYVEDNLANLSLVEELLRRAEAPAPLSAVQGSLGLELATVHQPDLILLDRHLPDMAGEEVLDQLRADPRTAGIPVIVISADVMPGRGSALRDAGAVAFLTKPIDVEAFWGALSTALGEKRRGTP